jgi:hypothetical protein
MLSRYDGHTGPIPRAIPAPPFPEPSFGQMRAESARDWETIGGIGKLSVTWRRRTT